MGRILENGDFHPGLWGSCITAFVNPTDMPLGDPHGGNFEYTVEGLPEAISLCTIPVRDVHRSLGFYRDILGFDVVSEDGDQACIRRGSCRVVLRRSEVVGVDTGIFFAVDSPYNTRKAQGIPPGPICNPGAYSLYAALDPNDTDYHYFIYDADNNKHLFSVTYDEHLQKAEELGE